MGAARAAGVLNLAGGKKLKQLGVKQIDLWQLHRIDPNVPRSEQFDAIKTLLDRKIIRYAGSSEVSIEDIEAASKVFKVATVQNRYNLINRSSEDVLEYCEKHAIGFIPWFPLGAGELAQPGSSLSKAVKRHHATPGQIALAWLLKRSPVMLPIPGTSKVVHLEENVAAVDVVLSDDEYDELDRAARRASDEGPDCRVAVSHRRGDWKTWARRVSTIAIGNANRRASTASAQIPTSSRPRQQV